MSGLFGVLSVASSGLGVQTRNIRTAGHNVANADNPDYTRQRSISSARPPFVTPQGTLGTGAQALTVERIHDGLIESQLRTHQTELGSARAQAGALEQIESVFNEQEGPGLAAALDDYYRAFSDLAAAPTPGAPSERVAAVAAAERLVATIRDLDGRLRDQFEATNLQIESAVPRVNELLREINRLNQQIIETEVTAPANDLRDMRDAAVRELSGLIDVRVAERESGAFSVSLSNGLPLVEGGIVHELSPSPAGSASLGISEIHVFWEGNGGNIDVSPEIGGGQIGGLLRVRETTLPAAIRSLDTVAYNLASTVNAVHAAGTGLDGTTGDFFSLPAQVENAARDLRIEAAILATPDAVAAGLTTDAGDNRNAAAIAALRDTAAAIFLPGDPPGPASGPARTLLEHVSTITIDVGEQARGLDSEFAAQERIVTELQNRRDEVSGVSIDEELASLIQMQAAFQANARILSVVDALVQDVVNIL